MPLAFLLIFGGALLVYMGWKNESLPGILQDTLSPISGKAQTLDNAPQGFVSPAPGSPNAGNPLFGNPFSKGGYLQNFRKGRTDQGVDLSGVAPGTPLPSLGTSKVIGVIPNWYKGQPFVWLQALDGPLAGRYYYYSEQITNIAQVGATLLPGQPVGYYANSGTGIEAGLATKSGQTLARATTGYTEGQATPAGSLFRHLLGL